MRDTSVVELIVGGDVAGVAAAYDQYADLIYAYCRSMLGNSEDTADATVATFVNASASAHRLHDPCELRAWLFALARNQCLHGRPAHAPALDTGALPAVAGNDADRAVLRAAVDGLSPDERDVFALRWHGLDADEAALVLGLSRDDVQALFSEARDQLETSVAVLLVCTHGRLDCPDLDELLGAWDGYLTERLRRKVARHIQGCDICVDSRDRELRPGLLLSLTAGALLRTAEGVRATIRPAPAWLRERLLWLVMTDDDPRAAADRRAMGRRLAPFGITGFPRPRRTARTGLPSLARKRPVLGLAGGIAALAAIIALVAVPGGNPVPERVAAGAGMGPAPRSGGAASPGIPAGQSARPSPSHQRASASASPSPTATRSTPAARPVIGVSQGTLSVSPSSIQVSAPFAATFTLTASGGPVTWSVSVPSAAAGQLAVSPSSGTLGPGQSATISVTVQNMNNFRTTLTISPGGHKVTVTVGLG